MCTKNEINSILKLRRPRRWQWRVCTYTGENFIDTKRRDDQAYAESLDALQKDEHKDLQQWAFVLELEDNECERNGDRDGGDDSEETRQHVTAQNLKRLDACDECSLLVAILSIHHYQQRTDDHGQCVEAEDDQCWHEIVTCNVSAVYECVIINRLCSILTDNYNYSPKSVSILP